MKRRTIVGELINFRGMVWAPVNEQGVVFLFGKIAHELGMYVEVVRPGYPDCIAKRYIGKGRWQEVRIEFEFKSSSFKGHDPAECDILVCWLNDWKNCPESIEIIDLSEEIKKLDNFPLQAPDQGHNGSEYSIDKHFEHSNKSTQKLFKQLDNELKKYDDTIYYKVAKYRVMYYSPRRVFATIAFRQDFLNIHLFNNGKKMKGVEGFSGDYGYKWGRIYIRSNVDLRKGVSVLKQSHKIVEDCIDKNIPTGWYAELE
jgi:hypothetical protein